MSVGSFTLYNSAKKDILDGTVDLDNDTVTAVLATTDYVPAATHDTYSDVTNICADADYAPKTLTSPVFTESAGTVKFDADDVTYGTTVSIAARYIVLVRQAGASLAGTDRLIGYMDLDDTGYNVRSTNSNFIVRWNANGLFQLS
jgi:hypothetical protein